MVALAGHTPMASGGWCWHLSGHPGLFGTVILAMVLTVLSFVPNPLPRFLGDTRSSLTSSDGPFYCLSHLEADLVAAKSPDWSLGQKFEEDGGQ